MTATTHLPTRLPTPPVDHPAITVAILPPAIQALPALPVIRARLAIPAAARLAIPAAARQVTAATLPLAVPTVGESEEATRTTKSPKPSHAATQCGTITLPTTVLKSSSPPTVALQEKDLSSAS